jgi:hypothetical protein
MALQQPSQQPGGGPTLEYGLPRGIPLLRRTMYWLAEHRRPLIVIVTIVAAFQISRMIPFSRRDGTEMCRHCAARRYTDVRWAGGIKYRDATTIPQAPTPQPAFIDLAHAHDWRPGGWIDRRGTIWGYGEDVLGGNDGDQVLTEEGIALMAVFAHAPVAVQRDIYHDIAAARNYTELEAAVRGAREKIRPAPKLSVFD